MSGRPADAFVTELRVRYAETDQMGVVYHTHYLVWCEVARTALIRELGSSYSRLEKEGLTLAVAEAQIRYSSSAYYDDRIAIAVWPSSVKSRTVTFEYSIERLPGDDTSIDEPTGVLARASTKLIALDRDGAVRTMPTPIFEKLRAAIPQ